MCISLYMQNKIDDNAMCKKDHDSVARLDNLLIHVQVLLEAKQHERANNNLKTKSKMNKSYKKTINTLTVNK